MKALIVALSGLSHLFGGGNQDACSGLDRSAATRMERIRDEWPLRGAADPVSLYVERLGKRLVDGAARGGKSPPGRFYVVRNVAPNAFAVGAGHFVVTEGIFVLVRNESELAAVLAHEIGHDWARHFCREDSAASEKFPVGSLVQHFDPKAEVEADAIAVEVLQDAGFDPRAMEAVLRCVAAGLPETGRAQLRVRIEQLSRLRLRPAPMPVADSQAFLDSRREVGADLGDVLPDLVPPLGSHGCQ